MRIYPGRRKRDLGADDDGLAIAVATARAVIRRRLQGRGITTGLDIVLFNACMYTLELLLLIADNRHEQPLWREKSNDELACYRWQLLHALRLYRSDPHQIR